MAAKRRPAAGQTKSVLRGGRKRVLLVLFVPSVERDGKTAVDQQLWVSDALEMLGRVFWWRYRLSESALRLA